MGYCCYGLLMLHERCHEKRHEKCHENCHEKSHERCHEKFNEKYHEIEIEDGDAIKGVAYIFVSQLKIHHGREALKRKRNNFHAINPSVLKSYTLLYCIQSPVCCLS